VDWQGTKASKPWRIGGEALALVRASPGGDSWRITYATPEGAALTIARAAREHSRVM